MNAHTSVHANVQPTAERAVRAPGDGDPCVVVRVEDASVHVFHDLGELERVTYNATGRATLFLTEGQALRLAKQLVEASRKVAA